MSRYPWFRMWNEARTDEKLKTLTDAEFRVWFRLMCLASDQPHWRGTIPAMDPYLLAIEVAGGDDALLDQAITKLLRLSVLERTEEPFDPGGFSFVKFEERQYDKPSDRPDAVAERVRKHRETQRNAVKPNETPSNAVKRQVTPSNAVKHGVTHRGEERRGDDTNDAPPISPPPPKPEPPTKPVESRGDEKKVKPRTERQQRADELYDRRRGVFEAYCRGLGIDGESLPATQRRARSFNALTVAILDTPECDPAMVEALTRYTRSAYQWRTGRRTPELHEVLAAFPEWDAAGRPETASVPPRASAGRRTNGRGDGDLSVDELRNIGKGVHP